MKVSRAWMFTSILLVGILIGGAAGATITAKIFIKNMPETTSITIGKFKVKGRNNEVSDVMDVTIEDREEPREEKRRRFRRK